MGPLAGLKVLEMHGIGPSPMCCMLLADLGASVLRIEREQGVGVGLPRDRKFDLPLRNREAVALDLKRPGDVEIVLRLVEKSDVLIEGYRPGVMERLGLGPDVCMSHNPGLVYGRMTGWGQDGPLAHAAGHDLNYISLAGAQHGIGRAGQPPTPPLNLVGDYGGGALYLALGILSAIYEKQHSGKGQVVDAAIVDGTASLMTVFCGMQKQGLVDDRRGTNILDSGAYFYDVYECADGKWISLAPIEPKFLEEMLRLIEIDPATLPAQMDRSSWPAVREIVAVRIKQRTQREWMQLLEGSDACFAPVLLICEAAQHPHLKARATYIEIDGVLQPAPAPRFSRSIPDVPKPPSSPEAAVKNELLQRWMDR
jgi:alpha-methylacyl-CoA racemase